MITETKPTAAGTPTKPIVLFTKGVLSDTAKTELRKAGYALVEATDTAQVKQFYPDTFNAASDRAKIKAFEWALRENGPTNYTVNDLRYFYVHHLKQEKAF